MHVDIDVNVRDLGPALRRALRDPAIKVGREVESALKASGQRAGRAFADGMRDEIRSGPNLGNAFADTERVSGASGDRAGRSFGSRFSAALSGSLRGLSGILKVSTLAAALTALGPAAAAVAPSMTILSGAVAALPAVGFAAAGAIGALVVGFQGMGDALSAGLAGDTEKYNEALKQLTPSAQETARAFVGLQGSFDSIRKATQENLFAGLADQVSRLGTTLLPAVQTGMAQVANAFNQQFSQVFAGITKGVNVDAISTIFDNIAESVRAFAPAIQPLITAFLTLGQVGSQFLPQLARGLASAAQSFATFIQSAAQTGRLQGLFTSVGAAVQEIGSIARQVIPIFGGIARALGPGISSVIKGLSQAFIRLGPSLVDIAGSFGDILSAIGPILPALSGLGPPLAAIARLFAQLVTAAAPLIPQIVQLASAILNGLVTALQPLIDPLTQLIAAILPPLIQFFTQLGPVLGTVAQLIAQMLVAVTPLLPPLIQLTTAILPLLVTVLQSVAPVLSALQPLFELLLQVLQRTIPIVTQVTTIWGTMFKAVATVISVAVRGIATVINVVFGGIFNFITGIWGRITSFISTAVTTVKNVVTTGFNALKSGATKGITALVDFVKGVPGKIIGALGDFGNLLLQVGKDIINGLLRGLQAAAGAIYDFFSNLIGGSIDQVMAQVQAHSPSKVFMRIGGFITEGLLIGLQSNTKQIMAASRALAQAAIPDVPPVVVPAPRFAAGSGGVANGGEFALPVGGGRVLMVTQNISVPSTDVSVWAAQSRAALDRAVRGVL